MNNKNKRFLKLSAFIIILANISLISVQADVLVIDNMIQVITDASKPQRGMPLEQILSQYGEPDQRRISPPPYTKKNPKITHWHYSDFSVYFEYNRVLHSVIHP